MSENLKFNYRNGFNDRNNISKANYKIQINDFDTRTRNKLCNLLKEWINDLPSPQFKELFYKKLLEDFYSEYLNLNLEYKISNEQDRLFEQYIYVPLIDRNYSDILTLVEYSENTLNKIKMLYKENMKKFGDDGDDFPDYASDINNLFEKELVGYRMIEGVITLITDDIEIEEIQKSLNSDLEGCKKQIKKSLVLLSNRDNPDYKNSIKESISAVECICKVIAGNNKATLGEALSKMEKVGFSIHPSLKKAFEQLYGYASNAGGIRHSEGLFESNVTFDEAKFCLVTCSAIINYLISIYACVNGDK